MYDIRFSHLVVNVSDLERSVSFHEMATSLRRDKRTRVPEQDFASLGLPRGHFDGWLLRDPGAPGGPAVHLVSWPSARREGTAYPMFWHVGLFRICTQENDVPGMYRRIIAKGGKPFTEPLMPKGQNVAGRPCFSTPDPDGVVLQKVTADAPRRMTHVALNCRDLALARAFYEGLGLRAYRTVRTTVPVPQQFGPGGEPATFDAAVLNCPSGPSCPDGRPVFSLDLCRWTQPEPVGEPYPTQQHNGIVRLGFAVRDLAALHADLSARGIAATKPETRDFGPEAGTREAVVTQDPDGVIVEFFDRAL